MAASIGFDIYAKDRASRTFNDVGHSADRAGGKLAKVGRGIRVAGTAMAAGLGLAAIGAYKLAKGAAEDEAAATKLAMALRNNAGATKGQVKATEAWITAQGKALGVTDDELRPALGKLVTATHDVGKAQRLASLAMNVSAGSGKSLDAVSTALMKAQNGQVSSLSRLGINVKNAKGETISFTEATKRMADTFRGQAAKAADTTAGRFARLKLMASEAGESIGYKLLPYATRFAGWVLSTGIPAMSKFGDWLNVHVTPALRSMSAYIQNNVIPAAKSFGEWFGNKIAPILADLYQNRIKQLMGAFTSLKGTVKDNQPELRKLGEWLKKGAEVAANVLGPALKFLGAVQIKVLVTQIKVVIGVLAGFVNGAQAVVGAAKSVGSWIADMAGKVRNGGQAFGELVRVAGEKIGALVTKVGQIPGKVKGAVAGAAGWLVSAGADVVRGFIGGIQSMAGSLVASIKASITDKLPGFVKKALGIHSPSTVFIGIGANVMRGLVRGIDKHSVEVDKVMAKVVGKVKATKKNLKDVLTKRDEFAAGFQMGDSIFGTPDTETTTTDAEGNEVTTTSGPTLASMKAFALKQASQASQVNADVQKLLSMGLSKSLIMQMQNSGSSGIAQMHALSTGSAADIAQFNALDKQTTDSYAQAGMAAGNALYVQQIEDAEKDAKRAKALADAIAPLLDDYTKKQMERLEFRLEGRTLVAVLKKEKRENGNKKLGLD